MNFIDNAIKSIYCNNGINDVLSIYKGKFCLYCEETIKCSGELFYKMGENSSINFQAKIYKLDSLTLDFELIKFSNASLEIPGYKIMDVEVEYIKNGEIFGFINDITIKSKDNLVDYIQFDIINMDKIPGKLVNHEGKVYAGRIEFSILDYTVIIDKSFGYNKNLQSDLVSKSGSVITHSGVICKKNGKSFKTKKIDEIIQRISVALSFSCGRYVSIPNSYGYKDSINVFRAWYKMYSSDYKFVYKWTSTISNYHNFEKYFSLICKKMEDSYYYQAILNILDWYIEAINGNNLANNIISIQTALEMLSYIVLVETEAVFSAKEFDSHPASHNIRTLLNICSINTSLTQVPEFSSDIINNFSDGVDVITYYRNSVVHPSKRKVNFIFEFEEMWNIILLGINYIELIILYLINYKGEYTNRFKDFSFGDVDLVPWL